MAFTAFRSDDYYVEPNDVLLFDTVWENSGDGYDQDSGVFTAPKSGLYMFFYTKNGGHDARQRACLFYNDMQSACSTGTLQKKGDRTYMKSLDRDNDAPMVDYFPLFSGFLICS